MFGLLNRKRKIDKSFLGSALGIHEETVLDGEAQFGQRNFTPALQPPELNLFPEVVGSRQLEIAINYRVHYTPDGRRNGSEK